MCDKILFPCEFPGLMRGLKMIHLFADCISQVARSVNRGSAEGRATKYSFEESF